MADDNAKLLIVLEAQSKKMQNQLVAATRQIDRFAAQAERRFDQMNAKNAASFDTLNKKVGVSLGALQAGIARAFAGVAALRGAQVLIDASTRIQNSLKVTGLAGEELDRVYGKLLVSAKANAAPLEALTQLYGRAALVQKELGVSNNELLAFTDNIAVALRVSGKSAEESSGALLQLSQALGSGIVRAEEFNSILEGAPTILQAAAAGIQEAGGSVSKLRQLMLDGKLSSEALFRGIDAGSGILRDKLADSVFTISQSFDNLHTTLIDLAGRFDTATGSTESFANSLSAISSGLEKLEGSRIVSWLGDLNRLLQSSGFLQLDSSLKEIEAILGFLDSAADTVADTFDGLASSTNDAVAAALGFENAAAAPAELRSKIEELAGSLNKGEVDADELRTALTKLGASPLNLAIQISQIMDLAAAAVAANGAISAINGGGIAADGVELQRSEQAGQRARTAVQPIKASDHKPPSIRKKGAKSPGEKFSDTLDKQREENRLIAERTALQATLNPLINDYGAAQAELTTRQELQSAATKAGIALTPELKATIDELAAGYAAATVEAAKLTEAQDLAQQSMADWFDLGKSAARGFIDDLVEGKTAAEALGNAFSKLGDKLLSMGLDALLGTGSGANPFGLIGKAFGFADGGIAANGRPKMFASGGVSKSAAVFGEAGPEAAVPLPDGRRIPVDLRMPANDNRSSGSTTVPIHIQIDATGADAAGLARVEQKVGQLRSELPGLMRREIKDRGRKWF